MKKNFFLILLLKEIYFLKEMVFRNLNDSTKANFNYVMLLICLILGDQGTSLFYMIMHLGNQTQKGTDYVASSLVLTLRTTWNVDTPFIHH